ncbi:DNA repair and recombination protein RAD52/RAD22 [Pseudoloma neurophilia]|uniref:DNA repair and recombination protein RAD52/RAD22 n=1 Tax=Pseudoloma neurophilia TaxID=146866 RepID=A0A0R0M1V0_9MICR|nr:DNA repair and recombination protein RAD52/RAD22 [Pseudoloma neurophilia]
MYFRKDEKLSSKDNAKKTAALLNKKLGPEFISYRQGFGMQEVAYLEGWAAISIANRIFGYNGWSSTVKSLTVDFLDEAGGRFSTSVSAMVKVTLSDGTSHEDVGLGSAENQRTKSMALEKAKKEAVTDALKRALRQFGNALGNVLYDKEFLNDIKKFKKEKKSKLADNELLRKTTAMNDDLNYSFIDDDLDEIMKET